jgi:hypothetical protein
MTQTKLGLAFKEFKDENKNTVMWLIGLTTLELGLIFSQNFYFPSILFYSFILLCFLSILLSLLIMYVIIAEADIELFSALYFSNKKEGSFKEDEAKIDYFNRMGKITRWLSDVVIEKKIYRILFLSFIGNTFIFMLLITLNMPNQAPSFTPIIKIKNDSLQIKIDTTAILNDSLEH